MKSSPKHHGLRICKSKSTVKSSIEFTNVNTNSIFCHSKNSVSFPSPGLLLIKCHNPSNIFDVFYEQSCTVFYELSPQFTHELNFSNILTE